MPTNKPTFVIGREYWVVTQFGLCRVEAVKLSPRGTVVWLKALECETDGEGAPFCCGNERVFESAAVRIVEAL